MAIRASADRAASPDVPPLERDGVPYSQARDGPDFGADTADGVLVATEVTRGKRRWVLNVYHAKLDPALESDVQWKFFTRMTFEADGRLSANESGQVFRVDVRTQAKSIVE